MSAVVAAALAFQDVATLTGESMAEVPWGLILRYVIAFGLAGAGVGFVLAGLFGRRGPVGWLLAFAGWVFVSVLSGAIGSFLGLVPDLVGGAAPTGALISLASGALVPVFALSGRPVLILAWLALFLLTHVLARRHRRAKDSS